MRSYVAPATAVRQKYAVGAVASTWPSVGRTILVSWARVRGRGVSARVLGFEAVSANRRVTGELNQHALASCLEMACIRVVGERASKGAEQGACGDSPLVHLDVVEALLDVEPAEGHGCTHTRPRAGDAPITVSVVGVHVRREADGTVAIAQGGARCGARATSAARGAAAREGQRESTVLRWVEATHSDIESASGRGRPHEVRGSVVRRARRTLGAVIVLSELGGAV